MTELVDLMNEEKPKITKPGENIGNLGAEEKNRIEAQEEAKTEGKEETEKTSLGKDDDSTEMAMRENIIPKKYRQIDFIEWVT